MKQSLLLFLSVFLLTATANTAQAFDKKDLAKLKKTKKCVKCDLSGADLKGLQPEQGQAVKYCREVCQSDWGLPDGLRSDKD